ncbi:MAG TPA: TusE/DsrC/DsvC family sulfur relay protein, partial [Gammaproteobacteria bacterium]|nr:TusE/DsrC/DsvC family sulfur relay protein [Gammaproteobacteria bacterium]
MAIEIDGKTFETDEEGYLVNLKDWVPAVADAMAKEDDLELT